MHEHQIVVHVKALRRIFVWGAAALLICFAANDVVSESMTMTTYYPAPSGVYKRLTATSGVRIGTYANSQAPDGGLIVSGNVGIGTTHPAGKLDVAGGLTVSGNVGIGTTAPSAKVHVVGDTNLVGNLILSGALQMSKHAVQPYPCDGSHDGEIALTMRYGLCACKPGTGWIDINSLDACAWVGTVCTLADTGSTYSPSGGTTKLGSFNGDACKTACEKGNYPYCSFYIYCYGVNEHGPDRICSGEGCGCEGGGCYDGAMRWDCH